MKFKNLFTAIFFIFIPIQELYAQSWASNFGVNGNSKFQLTNRNTIGDILLRLDDGSLIIGINSDYNQNGALFDRNIYIYKLNPNGLIDTSFGTNGCFFIPSTSFSNMAYIASLKYSSYDNFIYGLATSGGECKIFRINTNGILDTTFGNNGWLNESLNGLFMLLIQNDGKILLIGYNSNNNVTNQFLKRFNTNGTIDTTFGNNGNVFYDLTNYRFELPFSAKIHNNKITLVGCAYDNMPQSLATITRYNLDGNLDTSFGSNGFNMTNIGLENHACFNDLDINNNGDIIVAGIYKYTGGTGGWNGSKSLLVKYNSNGILDNSFNGNGIKIFNSINGGNDNFNSVSYLSNGGIIAGGGSGSSFPNSQTYHYLAKINNNGTLDSNFFNTGYVITNFENRNNNQVNDLITTSNDEIFTIGITTDVSNRYRVAIVCKMDNSYLSNNEVDVNKDVVKCFPNPLDDQLTIYSKINIKDIQLFSIDGRKLEDVTINNFEDKIILNFEKLSIGNYLLKITTDDGRIVTKKINKK